MNGGERCLPNAIKFAIMASEQKILLDCIWASHLFTITFVSFLLTNHPTASFSSQPIQKTFSWTLKCCYFPILTITCHFHVLVRCSKVSIMAMVLRPCAKTPSGTAMNSPRCPEIFNIFKGNTANDEAWGISYFQH